MLEHFQDSIQFRPSQRKNESVLVFSSKVRIQDVIQKLRSIDEIKLAASTIGETLLKETFDIHDKFCNVIELKSLWETVKIPDTLMTFFFNFVWYQKICNEFVF